MKLASQINQPESQMTPSIKEMTDKSEQLKAVLAEVREKFPTMVKNESITVQD